MSGTAVITFYVKDYLQPKFDIQHPHKNKKKFQVEMQI
jgi:hypothetical protein